MAHGVMLLLVGVREMCALAPRFVSDPVVEGVWYRVSYYCLWECVKRGTGCHVIVNGRVSNSVIS